MKLLSPTVVAKFQLLLLIYFYIQTINRIIAMTFVLNFSTSGMNSSVVLIVIVLTAMFLPIWKIIPKPIPVALVISTIGLSLSLIGNAVLAIVGSGLFQLAALPLLLTLMNKVEDKEISFAGGVALHIFLTVILGGLSMYSTVFGMAIFVLIILDWIYLSLQFKGDYEPSSSVIMAISFIFLQGVFLSFPGMLSTWFLAENPIFVSLHLWILLKYWGRIMFSLLGLLIAIIYPKRHNSYLFGIVAVVLLAEILFLGMVSVISLGIIQYLSVSLVCKEGTKHNGIKLGLIQFLLLILVFLYVGAGSWAFMPSVIEGITRGMAGAYLLLLGVLYFIGGIKL